MRHDWPVVEAIVDLPIKIKGNSKMHVQYFIDSVGGPE